MSLVKNVILQKKVLGILVHCMLLQSHASAMQALEKRQATSVNSEFLQACEAGDRAHLISLLEKGESVNAIDENRKTALHRASQAGHKEIVELLIAKGADVSIRGNAGWTALHSVADSDKEHTEIAELLIEKGIKVNAKGKSGWTALHSAADKGHKEIAKFLITKGADVNAENNFGLTALHCAASNGHEEITELLIANGADVNANGDRATALCIATERGHRKIAELLIANGAYVNARIDNRTALHVALWKGHKEIAELLIVNKADVNAKAHFEETPLHYAAMFGRKEIAELLIANGADINAKTNFGKTALHRNTETDAGWTALYYAILNWPKEIVKTMISNGAEVNYEDGATALHFASRKGHREIVELLVLNGADVYAKNKNGRTPSDNANYDLKNAIDRTLIFRPLRTLLKELLQANKRLLLSFDNESWLTSTSGYFYAELNKLVIERKTSLNEEIQNEREQAEKPPTNISLPLLDPPLPSPEDFSAPFCEKYRQEFNAGLALDGEGLQVMVTASMIEALEKEGYIIHKLFDIITGSSFAGILALGLTASKDGFERAVKTKDIIKLFSNTFHNMFSVKNEAEIKLYYSLKLLQDVLRNLFKETVLSNALSRVIVPCYANQPFDFDNLDAQKRPSCDFYLRDIACITTIDRSQEFFPAMPLSNLSNITSSSEYKNKSAECLMRNVEETLNREEMQKFRLLYCIAHQDEGNMRLDKKLEKMNELTARTTQKSSELNDQIAIFKREFDSLSSREQDERKKNIDMLEKERSQLAIPRYCCIKPIQSEVPSFDSTNLLDTYKEQGMKAAEDFIKKNEQFLRLLKENSDRKQHSTFFAS